METLNKVDNEKQANNDISTEQKEEKEEVKEKEEEDASVGKSEVTESSNSSKPDQSNDAVVNDDTSLNTGKKPEECVHYENGQAIYTDPVSKAKFVWNEEKKEWSPYNQPVFDGTNYKYTDENGVDYIWNTSSNAWEKKDENPERVYGFDGVHHTYTNPEDNSVYFWDREKKAWFPKVDDDFLANYQINYGFIENTSNEETKATETKDSEAGVKRKPQPQEQNWFEVDDEHNTKVYVSNLPVDITEQEFVELMQKCGLIMKDVNSNKWKVKLYTQPGTNELKGDALCTYIKKESVELAVNLLDEYEIKGKKIHVEKAKFQMKGEYNPALKPKKKRKKEKEKEKKIQEKLFDWRPDKFRGERENHERTVIIKNLFEPSIFDNHIELILEYTQDLREECSKCGVLKKVILHDKHPEGVAQVTFSDAEEADICIKLLNNRWFGKRKITAETWDGKTKYKVVENEEEAKQRLEKWNKYLEAENQSSVEKA